MTTSLILQFAAGFVIWVGGAYVYGSRNPPGDGLGTALAAAIVYAIVPVGVLLLYPFV